MELKGYQERVLDDLGFFLDAVDRKNDIIGGWNAYWEDKDVSVGLFGVPAYQNHLPGVPHVCMKVPTGGGKTFMACASLLRIFHRMPLSKAKVVVWLVPSDAILAQTIRTLSDTNHPYRQRLDRDFAGRVGVYTKDMLLSGQNFSPDTVSDMLTVCVMSYASLRIDSRKKDVRKVYQENGNLLRFADFCGDSSVLLADTPETALIQVLRSLSPVVVVDESHNAGSDLSVEMLSNLNPSFVLELTATPRKASNILSYVDARALKKENMVKLPVVVFNRASRQSVILDAISLRGNLEKQAEAERAAGGAYIRPIVLFQAQPNINEDSETFDKIKSMLIEMGIPKAEIAVKTSKVNELSDVDLMSRECPIRYIITVNALKEGWDCPFAYILASLANKTSRVDVEQIVGRILRQPYAHRHKVPLLNMSYVLTSSKDFHATLDSVVAGLNQSGFSKKDYRAAEVLPEIEEVKPKWEQPELTPVSPTPSDENSDEPDSFDDVDPEAVKDRLQEREEKENKNKNENAGGDSVSDSDSDLSGMMKEAEQQGQEYDRDEKEREDSGLSEKEWSAMTKVYPVQSQYREEIKSLRIPQFHLQQDPDLFGDEYPLLSPENLSEGFDLSRQDAKIRFDLAMGDMYKVDLAAEGEAVPQYKRVSRSDSDFYQKYMQGLPKEGRIRECARQIAQIVNRNNQVSTGGVETYVTRVISGMTEDELAVIDQSIQFYAQKIKEKIDSLLDVYRKDLFFKWIDSGKVICKPSYEFPNAISPAAVIDSIPYSLYEAERNDMNEFERRLLDVLVGSERILWWHRIIDRKGFCLNGYINHYPDFMVKTKSKKILLIEAKGDYLSGEDSQNKLALGRKRQELAGSPYRYFMVFNRYDMRKDGAYTIDNFSDMLRYI